MSQQQPMRVSLCGGDKCCPEVVVDAAHQEVQIGEVGNLVTLDQRAWNTLIQLIKTDQVQAL